MRLHPILSALRRNKVGAVVIAVQMGITLAILCNALFIIQQRVEWSKRPTGTDEARLFVIDNQWVGAPADLPALTQADVAALRSIPGVEDAYVANAIPLGGSGWIDSINLHPNQESQTSVGALYFADDHTIPTLGVKLLAGRNFNAAEITPRGALDALSPPVIIVTRALATSLFPGGNALGQVVYVESKTRPATIVGIVDRLQMPYTAATGGTSRFIENSVLEPFHFVNQESSYVVRTSPERRAAVMQQAQQTLLHLSRARVIQRVRTLAEWREVAHRDDRGLAVILGVVCAALVIVTAFGIVGLTSYWVTQRRRQIGIRRALGATRAAIVRYFQTENLMIAAAGAVLGIGLAVALNLWMVATFEMARLQVGYAVGGAAVVLVLGQLAVLWPALRAASIPPALATRSA